MKGREIVELIYQWLDTRSVNIHPDDLDLLFAKELIHWLDEDK